MPSISDLLDSDMEGNDHIDENSIISSASDATEVPSNSDGKGTTKKIRKRHRVTMPKSKSRIAKSPPASVAQKPTTKAAANKRKELEKAIDSNVIVESRQEKSADNEGVMETEETVKAVQKPTPKKRGRKPKVNAEQMDNEGMTVEQTPMIARSNHAQSTAKAIPKVARASKAPVKAIHKPSIPDTQIESSATNMEMEEVDEIATQQPPSKRARTDSRTRQEAPYRRRAGSASDTERGDPNLRRKLGDITRKFENIDMKYKNLKEVGISEANVNVEKLRKQCEATTEASNNLISSLKKELAMQAPLVQDARRLKKELQSKEEELFTLRASQVSLNASLVAASNEVKALQAKLAASRTVSVSTEQQPVKTPGSAMKMPKSATSISAEVAHAAQTAQMKLDLYSDLTGLIVRNVKRAEDGETYDCIQTGRNGTLHFKLFIDQEDAKSASFEETEFLYTPLLDTDRDHNLIELMPPYLVDDITFARQNASKFYQRVVDTLTRRINEE